MKQLDVLVTSGGTISKVDDVRHVGNFSNGTTGSLIAEEFLKTGSRVHYLHNVNAVQPFKKHFLVDPFKNLEEEICRIIDAHKKYSKPLQNLEKKQFDTFESYYSSVKSILEQNPIDVIVLAAAVSDYSAVRQEGKISSDQDTLEIKMIKNPKVISLIKQWNPRVFQVGFKLLSQVPNDELIETAYQHGKKNNSDLTVANSLNKEDFTTFSTYIITPEREVLPVKRAQLAPRLVQEIYKRVS